MWLKIDPKVIPYLAPDKGVVETKKYTYFFGSGGVDIWKTSGSASTWKDQEISKTGFGKDQYGYFFRKVHYKIWTDE